MESCNPDIELCTPQEVIIRPKAADLFNLTFSVYGLAIISPVFITFIAVQLFPGVPFDGFTLILFIISTALFLYTYWIPMLLSLVYFIFKDNFFLFSWVDSVLAFLIEYVISNLTPLYFILGAIFPTIAFVVDSENEWRGLLGTFLILYALHAYFLEVQTMKLSVGAIRYLKPVSWDKEEMGDYLWPAIIYWLGIKEHSNGRNQSQ